MTLSKACSTGFGDSGTSSGRMRRVKRLRKDNPPAANIQGVIHSDSYMGNALDQYPRRRKKPRDENVGKSEPKTLYVSRPVLNAPELIDWAKAHGFPTTLTPDDLHVTIAFSKEPVDWSLLAPQTDTITVPAARKRSGLRFLKRFGEATVLCFDSPQLNYRWRVFKGAGASWDYKGYDPHVTLSWQAPADKVQVGPYLGPIVLGPEVFKEVNENWKDSIVEKAADDLGKHLGAKAGASDYIDDFVHSTNAKFKGKSKEERIRMALGAYYSKMELDYNPSEAEVGAWLKKFDTFDANDVKKAQINDELGVVFGYAIVCKVDGQPYYDLNIDQNGARVPEHIPEDAMLKAATDFMLHSRNGNEMHTAGNKGTYVFAFPMTTEIAKAMGIDAKVTGLLVAYKPPDDVLAKFKDGTYKGFSIEGRRLAVEEHE